MVGMQRSQPVWNGGRLTRPPLWCRLGGNRSVGQCRRQSGCSQPGGSSPPRAASRLRHMLVALDRLRHMLVALDNLRHMLVALDRLRHMLVFLPWFSLIPRRCAILTTTPIQTCLTALTETGSDERPQLRQGPLRRDRSFDQPA